MQKLLQNQSCSDHLVKFEFFNSELLLCSFSSCQPVSSHAQALPRSSSRLVPVLRAGPLIEHPPQRLGCSCRHGQELRIPREPLQERFPVALWEEPHAGYSLHTSSSQSSIHCLETPASLSFSSTNLPQK